MRFVSLLTHSTTLLLLQQLVALWFLIDFFLARESFTANQLLKDRLATKTTNSAFQQISAISSDLKESACRKTLNEEPTFDKIVLVVIDALGAEFLPSFGIDNESLVHKTSHKMPFLEGAIQNNKAIGFIAKAATPTVTMPRIKALVSGTIPSFLEIVYNLARDVSDFNDDNILQLAKSRNKSLVFYGDDTWLSLFDRSMFKRSRETHSFFASDYTSVDTNVTEMALPETRRHPIDWDYLILHYLGLDHIGHVFGSNQVPLVEKKLLEMDAVLEEIYNNLRTKEDTSLIVVCGDHGMSREGNHGGDTKLETETAMIFVPINRDLQSPQRPYENRVLQIDLAATLATLNKLPIPRMSRGVVMERLLESLWADDGIKSTCTIVNNLVELVQLLDTSEFDSPDGLGLRLLELLKQSKTSDGNFSINKLKTRQYYELAREMQAHMLRIAAAKSNPILVASAVLLVMLLSLRNLYRASIRLLLPLMHSYEKLLCVLSILTPILLQGSTYYIETENIFHVFIACFTLVSFCLTGFWLHYRHSLSQDLEMLRLVQLIISFAIAAVWNNTDYFKTLQAGWLLPVLAVLSMCNHSRSASELDRKPSLIIFWAIGLCVLITKMYEETEEKEPNHINQIAAIQLISFLSLCGATAVNLLIAFQKGASKPTSIVQKLATSWMWLVFLLSRSRNYPFLIANVMMEASLNSISNSFKLSPISRALSYSSLSTFAFYGQGNSNLFTSLDVKPGFFAQTSFQLWLAVPLIACATCGTQIYWYLKLFQRVQGEKEQERMVEAATMKSGRAPLNPPGATPELIPEGTKDAVKDIIEMRNFLIMGYYMFVCIALRNHLFIWSVFSPKLIYVYVTTTILSIATALISTLPQLLLKLCGRSGKKFSDAYKKIVT